MRRLTSIAAVSLLVALAAGCASPMSRFYTLSAANAPAAASSTLSIVVGPVSVPAVVDRPQIVVTTGPNQVRPEEFNRWASPLQNNISRVVAENLVALLGTPRVILFSQTLGGDVDYRAAIEVQRFESAPGEPQRGCRLDGKPRQGWQVTDGPHHRARGTSDKGYDALAAAHSRGLARLSRDIADGVLTLERSSPVSQGVELWNTGLLEY